MQVDQPLEIIARDLALECSVLNLLPSWCDEFGVEREGVASLEGYLATRTKELAKDLAGIPVKIESPSLQEIMEFALTMIPQWLQMDYLTLRVAVMLAEGLMKKCKGLGQG